MRLVQAPLLVLCTCVWTFILPMQAMAGSASPAGTPCEHSALDMRQACQADTFDNFRVNIANCRQLTDAADRHNCWQQAYSERQDALQICRDQLDARRDACDLLGERRYRDPLTDPAVKPTFVDPDSVMRTNANPYVSLQAGRTYVTHAEDDLGVVYVTPDSREINGVKCRVVLDVAVTRDDSGDYLPVEVTDDWYAQDDQGNVYYCGELSREYEDGILRDLDGSFESGLDYAEGGVLVLAAPAAGQAHRQEYALGDAEDIVEYLDRKTSPTQAEGGGNANYPCHDNCLKTHEFSPLEPDVSEIKYYAPGTGFVLSVESEDGSITTREELVCDGYSLAVLGGAGCGVEDPAALQQKLCELRTPFCERGED